MALTTTATVVVVLALLTLLIFVVRLLHRKFFGKRTGVGGGRGGRVEGGQLPGEVAKCFNDAVVWGSTFQKRFVNEWTEEIVRSLNRTAKNRTNQTKIPPSTFQIRFEKIDQAAYSPQFSNLSTKYLSSEKSLIMKANVHWNEVKLSTSIVPLNTNNVCSICCDIVLFEISGSIEAVLSSINDNQIELLTKFITEPKMKVDVKLSHEVTAGIERESVEKLLREVISGTEVQLPLLICRSSGPEGKTGHFDSEQQEKQQTTTSESSRSENLSIRKRKLLVKIIKANGLVSSQEGDLGSRQPFCVALMDSPIQKYTTSAVKNTSDPFFDEHFFFDLDQTSKRMTFELRDKEKTENDDFLGNAVITVTDLIVQSSIRPSRHVLPLTGRGPMTFGALTIEVTVIDQAQFLSVMSLTPNVEHVRPSSESSNQLAFPTVTVSEADMRSTSKSTLTKAQMDRNSMESRSLPPPMDALPPKGEKKKSTFVGAIKKRFKRKKTDSRSHSADRVHQDKSSFGEGIYLTPPPSRASANMDYEIPDAASAAGVVSHDDVDNRSRSNSFRSSLRRLFRRKRTTEDSPTRLSYRGPYDLTPEGSPSLRPSMTHEPSPSAYSGRKTPPEMTSSLYEQHLR